MSATNTTTNYNLPIFIGSDKPAWLVDFNGAMNAIDAQMKVNADAIATKSPILTFNDTTEIDFTKTGDVITANLASGVSDKVGRALVTPVAAPAAEEIVSINTNGAQDSLVIGSGLNHSNGVLTAIDLDLNNITTGLPSPLPSGVTVSSGTITCAKNADGSVGKIYGNFGTYNTTNANVDFYLDTGLTVKAPDSLYMISPAGLSCRSGSYGIANIQIYVQTDGHVWMAGRAYPGTTYQYLWPCVYFFSDFGDQPMNP